MEEGERKKGGGEKKKNQFSLHLVCAATRLATRIFGRNLRDWGRGSGWEGGERKKKEKGKKKEEGKRRKKVPSFIPQGLTSDAMASVGGEFLGFLGA